MSDPFKSPLAHMPLLQNFQTLEFRTPYHATDFPPFSMELKSHTQRIRSIALTFLVVGLLAVSTITSYELWQFNHGITGENAGLELAQVALLVLATVLQGWRGFITIKPGLQRDIRIGLALFAFTLFLREVDIDKLGTSHFWKWLETGLRVITLIGFFGFAVHMLRRIKIVLRCFKRIILAPTVLISLLACLFYTFGWPFDKELFNIDKGLSLWFEETLELNACLLFFVAGFTSSVKSAVVSLKAPSF
jgi:hypothetical protein